MTNNDILRRLRYTFDFDDSKMIALFAQADHTVTRQEVSDWLKKEDDPDYKSLSDFLFATFLNGLINDMRGKKEGPPAIAEERLNNNIIFRKLKIAVDLQAEDVLDVIAMGGIHISKHELSAFFRKPGHKHYRECKDQVLRSFLKGLQLATRPDDQPTEFSWD